MKGYDYNAVVSIFYVSYIIVEVPLTLACKWMGPGWFIPGTTVLFGICSFCTAYVKDLPQLSAVRFLLGIFEAGMMPGIAYYLSRWYRRSELAFRLALYIVMAPLAGAFGGLLASAILTLDSFAGVETWRMIFAIEGIITVILGLIGFVTLTDRPETARWLTAEEKRLAIDRIKSERIGTTKVLDKMDKKKIWAGISSPLTLSTAFAFLLNNITVQGLAFFAPTIVGTIYKDSTVVQKQLYTVPPYVVGGFFVLLFSLISWRIDKRQILMIAAMPMMIIGYAMFLATTVSNVRYAAVFILASTAFALGALSNAQVSANVVSDTARSAAIGFNVMAGNTGGLIASWTYLPWDGPRYNIGNGINFTTGCVGLIVCAATLFWMKRDNKKRELRDVDAELSGLTATEIEDLDWRHPSFRWKP